MTNQINSLSPLLTPRSIAIIGASKEPAKLGYVLVKNVIDYGFQGAIYPINPAGGEVLGKKIYTNIKEIGEAVDLALVSIPNRLVPNVLKEVAEAGTKSAVILSSGFGEMAREGKELQDFIRKIREDSGMRIIGPNCMGVYNLHGNLNATYFWELPRKQGNISFISQSGAYGGIFFSEIRKRNIGISKFISIGNQVDVTHIDLLKYLAEDNFTEVVALFIEEIKDGGLLMDVARLLSKQKPIIAFKVGRTVGGARAVKSHTGSMAGSFEVYKSALKQSGVILARDTDEFFDFLSVFSSYPKSVPAKETLGILTISGGPCVAASDACEEIGIKMPVLSEKLRREVRKLIPEFGADTNPVDMTPQMTPDNFIPCVSAVAGDEAFGGILAINIGLDREQFGEAFVLAKKQFQKPILSFVVDVPIISKKFSENGIPIFSTPERAIDAYAGLIKRKKILEGLSKYTPHKIKLRPSLELQMASQKGKTTLNEYESKKVLKEYNIPVCREAVLSEEKEALKIAKSFGYPVVLKIFGDKFLHKSDRGGVHST